MRRLRQRRGESGAGVSWRFPRRVKAVANVDQVRRPRAARGQSCTACIRRTRAPPLPDPGSVRAQPVSHRKLFLEHGFIFEYRGRAGCHRRPARGSTRLYPCFSVLRPVLSRPARRRLCPAGSVTAKGTPVRVPAYQSQPVILSKSYFPSVRGGGRIEPYKAEDIAPILPLRMTTRVSDKPQGPVLHPRRHESVTLVNLDRPLRRQPFPSSLRQASRHRARIAKDIHLAVVVAKTTARMRR